MSEIVPDNNTDLTPSAPPPPPSPSFRVPADYYTASPAAARPLFPRWVPYGCGSAAALFLILLFVGAAVVNRGGMGELMAFMIGTMDSEMRPMYAAEVSKGQREALQGELETLRDNLRSDRVSVTRLDPILKDLRKAVSDERLSAAEVESLTGTIRAANREKPTASSSGKK